MRTWESYKQTMAAPESLWAAAKDNDVAALDRLLAGGSAIDERDHKGHSPLMLAAYAGNREAFLYLLERGADPSSHDLAGNSILMGVAFKGNVDFARRLIAAGADVSARNFAGLDAKDFAAQFGRVAMVDLFNSHGKE